jgi:hypothetical protein
MKNGSATGLYKTILPLALGRVPHVPRQQCPPAQANWLQPPPPINFTNSMPQMMPPTPYHFGPTPPQDAQPAPPAPAPPAGTMMITNYAPYPQPHPF